MKHTRFLWITDPWPSLDHPHDTTLRLAEEALLLGYESFWASSKDLLLINSDVFVKAKKIISVGLVRNADEFTIKDEELFILSYFSSIQYRADPPVDLDYIQPLQLLALAQKLYYSTTRVESRPSTLLTFTEKTLASIIPSAMPPTTVTSDVNVAKKFIENNINVIIKPLNSCQSRGVKAISYNDTNSAAIFKEVKHIIGKSRSLILLQAFLSKVYEGEKRLFFLDGQVFASCLKMPVKGSFIVNIDGGSEVKYTKLDSKDLDLAKHIGKTLLTLGVRFAAVDIIDGFITDLNITSPGLLVQLEKLYGKNFAKIIIETISHSL